uniref:Serine aminopeptidase S33 domain-containing protein n=1 Tax=Grammatophora oceanica TaxID=210454 RepID=A0A7S1USD1_9STRA|mmetsp:Transcript_19968/g.29583  ORF Transcript_19968/g.29583 Transcript_19968/m.29583 type:complete len:401 (+) Transcript_19968:99-1301(+)
MCCCCPPAIRALFCLYVQSGCSKGSVAGALTFFPPDPPLYKFERIDRNGNVVHESDDDEDDESLDEKREVSTPVIDEMDRECLDDDEELLEVTGPTGRVEPIEHAGASSNDEDQEKSPAQQLMERAQKLRRRAKARWVRDCKDTANGVRFRLLLDSRLVSPPSRGAVIESVKLPNTKSKGYLATVIYKVPKSAETPHTKTIIYSHGNATDVGAMYMLQSVIVHALACNVVSYDYSGYGESGGVPMENNTYTDIETVYEYVKEKVCKGNAKNIVLYGQSVGSGPSCHLAYKNNELGGLILHSPFTSGMRVLTPSRLLSCLDIYPNINKIRHVRCPTMVIHGKLDQEVAFHHGREMHENIPEEYRRDPWWIRDRGHNDITEGPGMMAEYVRRLRRFLSNLDE